MSDSKSEFKPAGARLWTLAIGILYGGLAFLVYFLLSVVFFPLFEQPLARGMLILILVTAVLAAMSAPASYVACRITQKGIELPVSSLTSCISSMPESAVALAPFWILEIFTPAYKLITWDRIIDVTDSKKGLVLDVLPEPESRTILKYRLQWPIQRPEDFSSLILEYTSNEHPLRTWVATNVLDKHI